MNQGDHLHGRFPVLLDRLALTSFGLDEAEADALLCRSSHTGHNRAPVLTPEDLERAVLDVLLETEVEP